MEMDIDSEKRKEKCEGKNLKKMEEKNEKILKRLQKMIFELLAKLIHCPFLKITSPRNA